MIILILLFGFTYLEYLTNIVFLLQLLLITTCLTSGFSMCVLATWFLLDEFSISPPGWIPVLTLCICIFCDAAGLMPIAVVIAGETFSFKVHNQLSLSIYLFNLQSSLITLAICYLDKFNVGYFQSILSNLDSEIAKGCF